MGGKRQRRETRVPTVAPTSVAMMLPVAYQVQHANGEAVDPEIRTGLAVDVSRSGMCLQIRHVPAALAGPLSPEGFSGRRMALDLTLPRKRLRLSTRLAWLRPDADAGPQAVRIGVEFIDASEEQRAEILSFARDLARRPRIQRLVLASLALLLLTAAAGFWWSQRGREAERAEYAIELANTEAKYTAEITKTEGQYQSVANALDEQTDELNDLALRIRGLGVSRAAGKAPGTKNGSGQAAIETIRSGLAGVRERILALEEQILPDGTCVSTDRCGEQKCCTWQGGLCLCDACCVK